MLWRNPKGGGRAWQKQRVQDTLTTQRRLWRSIQKDEVYGGLPDELDHPEIWSDWSGGYGVYKRRAEVDNHYHIGFNLDTRFPGMAFLAQAPQLLNAARYNTVNINADFFIDVPQIGFTYSGPVGAGSVLALANGVAVSFTPTQYPNTLGSAFDVSIENNNIAGVGHRPILAGSFVYIPVLTGSGFYRRSLNGQTYTQGSLPATWFQVANGQLWRGHSRNLVQSCPVALDPMSAGNWNATISLGNGFLQSLDARSFEDNLFVGFADGLYQGNSTGTFNNVATDIGENVNLDNVRDIAVHNGGLVFAEGMHVWWFKPSSGANSTLRQIWPSVDVRPISSFNAPSGYSSVSLRGRVTCLEGFGRWLYAGVFNGSQSQVFCGYDASGAGPYVWHPMQLFNETAKISRIHVDNITVTSGGVPIPRRVWAATDASFGSQTGCTAPMYMWPIPVADELPFGDPTFSANYCSMGYMEQSLTDSDVPGVWKAWRKLETWQEAFGGHAASTYIAIGAVIDNTLSSTLDATVFLQRPKDWHYFQNNNNDAIGQALMLTMEFHSPNSDSTPVLRSVVGHSAYRPRIAEVVAAKVRIADGIRDRQGGEMRPGATQLDELDTMSRASNPFPLTDLVGRTYPVIVLPGVDQEEGYQDGSDYPEIMATVKMGLLDASWNAAPAVPFHPDGG